MAFKFEKLKVWQSAVELSGQISELTEKFPKRIVCSVLTEFNVHPIPFRSILRKDQRADQSEIQEIPEYCNSFWH